MSWYDYLPPVAIAKGLYNGLTGALTQPTTAETSDAAAAAADQARDRSNYNNALTQQQQVLASYWNAINGNGPSVAQTQLEATTDANNRAIQSAAAGANGQGGVLSRYAALNAIGNNGAQADQAAALLRAQEISQARAGAAGVSNNMSTGAQNLYQGDQSTGLGYNKLAAGIQMNNENNKAKILGSLISAGGQLAGYAMGRPPIPGMGTVTNSNASPSYFQTPAQPTFSAAENDIAPFPEDQPSSGMGRSLQSFYGMS